jgi:DNA-binding NarL/FixJ family response regulator/two-component sensor histidine kinase
VLRGPADVDGRVTTAPSPSISQLDDVLGQVRQAGIAVDLRVEGSPSKLPPGVDLAAYRIVQEALTNTVKHSGADEAAVIVRYEPGYVTVSVTDAGDEAVAVTPGRPAGPGRRGRGPPRGIRRVRAGRHRRTGGVLRGQPDRGPRRGRRIRRHRPVAGVMTGGEPIRVVVADDQELVRTGFCVILEATDGITVVAEAANGAEAVQAAAEYHPDVILMDVRMPEMDGLEATRLITGGDRGGPPRVVMLTTFDFDDYVYEALRSGASGFLLKDAPRHDLIAAIKVAAAGNALLAPSVTMRLIDAFARRPPETLPAPSRLASLTARERDILLRLARGLTNAEIAADLVVSEATVKSHVGNLLAKLGLRDRVQAVILAYETGIVRPGDPDADS